MYTDVLIMAVNHMRDVTSLTVCDPFNPNQQLTIVFCLTNCYSDDNDYDEDEDDDGQFEEWAMGKQLGGEES